MYALMKDCWQKEPEKRLEFTTISMRLKCPYHNYDVPPGYDLLEQTEEPREKEAAESGNVELGLCFFVQWEQALAHTERIACLPWSVWSDMHGFDSALVPDVGRAFPFSKTVTFSNYNST